MAYRTSASPRRPAPPLLDPVLSALGEDGAPTLCAAAGGEIAARDRAFFAATRRVRGAAPRRSFPARAGPVVAAGAKESGFVSTGAGTCFEVALPPLLAILARYCWPSSVAFTQPPNRPCPLTTKPSEASICVCTPGRTVHRAASLSSSSWSSRSFIRPATRESHRLLGGT